MSSMQDVRGRFTDVFHGSREGNLNHHSSTSRTFHYESTMLQFRYVEIHGQRCSSSTDLVEKASSERFPAILGL
jgi:hypothetical protein